MCFCRSTISRRSTRILHHYSLASSKPDDTRATHNPASSSLYASPSPFPSPPSPLLPLLPPLQTIITQYSYFISLDTTVIGRKTHFFALARLSRLSASCLASNFAFCCSRFSAAVIRGTISSKGFSTILIVLIFGGLSN
jgi:hypothetical protein